MRKVLISFAMAKCMQSVMFTPDARFGSIGPAMVALFMRAPAPLCVLWGFPVMNAAHLAGLRERSLAKAAQPACGCTWRYVDSRTRWNHREIQPSHSRRVRRYRVCLLRVFGRLWCACNCRVTQLLPGGVHKMPDPPPQRSPMYSSHRCPQVRCCAALPWHVAF